MRNLSETRKADRAVMSEELQTLIKSLGAEVIGVDELTDLIFIHVAAPGGLHVTVDLDRHNPVAPNAFYLSWFMRGEQSLCPDNFPAKVSLPGHKASSEANGYEALREVITTCLTAAANGKAYKKVA